MRLVLDTNEFIAALGVIKHPASAALFKSLVESSPKHTLNIPRTIIMELYMGSMKEDNLSIPDHDIDITLKEVEVSV